MSGASGSSPGAPTGDPDPNPGGVERKPTAAEREGGIGARLKGGASRAWRLTENAVPAFFEDRCPQLAAGVSYYALFSVFPVAIVLTAVFGLIVNDAEAKDKVVEFIVDRLPVQESGGDDLRSALDRVASGAGAVGLVGLVGVAYAASALMGAVRNALNAVWDFDEGRPPLRGKALDVLLVIGLGSLFALSLAIALVEGVAADAARDAGVPETLIDGTFSFLSVILPIALAVAVFTILLRYVPAHHQRLRDIWPGVLLATIGYQLVQLGFTFYLDNFARYSAIYGSLGAIVAFMVFVYVAAMAFLMGAEYARLWPAVRAGELDPDPDEEGEPFGQQILGFLKGLAVSDRSDKRN
jgi:membrane protein